MLKPKDFVNQFGFQSKVPKQYNLSHSIPLLYGLPDLHAITIIEYLFFTVIRGFEANRVLLVIDGVRMNNAIYRSGHLQNAITIDPYTLERTEIIFGPSSVGYGSDALGGVVHFYTKKPKINNEKIWTLNGVMYYCPH